MEKKVNILNNNISYIYEKSQSNNGNLVILLHGFGVDKHEKGNFDVLSKKLLENNFNVLRFDFLGHGHSNGNTEDLTIEIAIKEIEYFIKKISFNHIYMVGVSYGGGISVIFSEKHNVEKLVLWSPLIDYENNIIHPQNHFCKDFLGDEALKQIKEKGFANFGFSEAKINMNLFNDAKKYSPSTIVKKLNIPIKIFHGKKDIIIPYEQSKNLDNNKNISCELVENGIHCFYDETSNYVISKTINFLLKK